MGARLCCLREAIVSSLSLKSNLVPTKMIGVLGLKCVTSGTHCKAHENKVSFQILLTSSLKASHLAGAGGWRNVGPRGRPHLVLHVIKTFGGGEGETDDEHISSRIAERPELIVLARSLRGERFSSAKMAPREHLLIWQGVGNERGG
jgi:hypothetical protein